MATERNHIRELVDKLEALPPERIAEVEDFIDFLKQRDTDSVFQDSCRLFRS